MKIVVTGAAGFIGTNLLNYYKRTGQTTIGVAAIDKLGFGSSDTIIKSVPFLYTNLQNLVDFPSVFEGVDAVVNLAAETHVDRSLSNFWQFFESNVRGTASLLDAIERSGNKDLKLVHISTDEVYGPVGPGYFSGFDENSNLDPHNPYSGTKAAAEMLVRAWTHQNQRKTTICRLCNVFGPYQYPEKFIPKAVIKMLRGEKVPVYGTGNQVREWLYVGDACTAIDACLKNTATMKPGAVDSFNFSSGWETENIEILKTLCDALDIMDLNNVVEYVQDRPGHDNGYKMSSRAARTFLGWKPEFDLRTRVMETAGWFENNLTWAQAIVTRNPKLLSKQPWLEKWN